MCGVGARAGGLGEEVSNCWILGQKMSPWGVQSHDCPSCADVVSCLPLCQVQSQLSHRTLGDLQDHASSDPR